MFLERVSIAVQLEVADVYRNIRKMFEKVKDVLTRWGLQIAPEKIQILRI